MRNTAIIILLVISVIAVILTLTNTTPMLPPLIPPSPATLSPIPSQFTLLPVVPDNLTDELAYIEQGTG
jgi:hypothetical protein